MKIKKLFAIAALLLGSTSAFAQLAAQITKGNYVYDVTSQVAATKTATATINSVAPGKSAVKADYSIDLVGSFEYVIGDDTWTVSVTGFSPAMLPAVATQNHPEAQSVVIPKEFTEIPAGAFDGCSGLKTITFESGSQVTTIGSNAFATTQITNFDFSLCTKLAELPNEVFVETGKNNTFITTVKLPSSPLFKHINGAFKNLTNLTTITNLENSYIQEVIASAFDGCTSLKTLSLPGNNLKYIDKNALKGSNIETLTINVSSLVSLGGGTVGAAPTYTWTAGAAADNLYGKNAVNNTPLKSLTLTGTLTGVIAKNAFAWCDKINAVLDLTGVVFGSTAQIEGEAFATCYRKVGTAENGIQGVKLGDITDNKSGLYTIAKDAFKGCDLLASVEIGDITTAMAIDAAAFGNKLKTVKIGTVKADDVAINAGAFVFANVDGTTLELAQGTGKYLNANNTTKSIFGAGAFDFSAVVANMVGGKDVRVYPTIKIGEIKSLGGVFVGGDIVPAATTKELTFTGAIAANGIDAQPFSANTDLKTITFNGAIGTHGIGGTTTGTAFANLTKITTLEFKGLLAENAVEAGAFVITDDGTSKYALKYTCAEVPDYTVNPFEAGAFDAAASKAAARFIALTVANENLLANYKDAAAGLNGTDATPKFDIWLVEVATPAVDPVTTFLTYRDENEQNVAWGRYIDLMNVPVDPTTLAPVVTKSMFIDRYQKYGDVTDPNIKVTLYGVYTDVDKIGQTSTVYMVPLQVTDGQYNITGGTPITIVKVEKLDGNFAEKDINVKFTDKTATTTSHWFQLFGAPTFAVNNATVTNQQLWDGTSTTLADPEIIWKKLDGTYVAAKDKADNKVQNALYIMTDPSKYNGFRIDKNVVAKGGAYVKDGWFYTFLHNFDGAAAARVVWMDEAETTAIFGVKEIKKAEANDNTIYTLQGVRVSEVKSGQLYIQNGKKFIAK